MPVTSGGIHAASPPAACRRNCRDDSQRPPPNEGAAGWRGVAAGGAGLAAALRADVVRFLAALGAAMRIAARWSLLSFFAALKNRLTPRGRSLRHAGHRARKVTDAWISESWSRAGTARQQLQTGDQRNGDRKDGQYPDHFTGVGTRQHGCHPRNDVCANHKANCRNHRCLP
ncbi:hypothetical protein G6F68_013377 [Rhizopus microsporus]|nr:hypothetical protein G6F68_013377 [Rhizopus microsporus]